MSDISRSHRVWLGVLCAAAFLIATACGADSTPTAVPSPLSPAGNSGAGLPQGSAPVTLDASTFTVDIDHPYWPMTPGTRWTYREVDEEGKAVEVIVTVTNQTRTLANGVTARVVRDSVFQEGELIEDTVDWYAQDADGNLWYLGEDTVEFDGGSITRRRARGKRALTVRSRASWCPPTRLPGCGTGRSTTPARRRTAAKC